MHYRAVVTGADWSSPLTFKVHSGSSYQCVNLGAGAGEPFVTAAGVLGLMAVWRCFYTACEGYCRGYGRCSTATVQPVAPGSRHASEHTEQRFGLPSYMALQTSTSGIGERRGVHV